ncbi:hypothetical protein JW824_08855 [bacterium]|nr:hypothetical protein [bacterium]
MVKQKFIRSWFLWIALFVIFFIFFGCSNTRQPSVDGEKVREYANALYNRELYDQAIREYQRYLDLYDVDKAQCANINFIIGNIYFDRLNDYENAMAYYLKVKHIYPESDVLPQVDKRVVTCLERLQRTADAKQALDEATALEPESIVQPQPGTVIAKIGDREITSGDLEYAIGQLPEYLRSQFEDKQGKINFLQQYIANELFYDAAKREELDLDKDVIDGAFQAKKSLMVQKYLEEQIASQIQISADDVDLYYKANKEKYTEKDEGGDIIRQKPFEEVQQEVAEDLALEKQQKALDALLQRMMTAEKVEIYDDLVN